MERHFFHTFSFILPIFINSDVKLLDPGPALFDVRHPPLGARHGVDDAALVGRDAVAVADDEQVLLGVRDVAADAEELLGDLHGVDASQGHDHGLALALEGQRSKVSDTKW